jgi:hypothetical protein
MTNGCRWLRDALDVVAAFYGSLENEVEERPDGR